MRIIILQWLLLYTLCIAAQQWSSLLEWFPVFQSWMSFEIEPQIFKATLGLSWVFWVGHTVILDLFHKSTNAWFWVWALELVATLCNLLSCLMHSAMVCVLGITVNLRSCRGRAVKTSDCHTGGPQFNPGPAVAPLGKVLYPHCLVFRRIL